MSTGRRVRFTRGTFPFAYPSLIAD